MELQLRGGSFLLVIPIGNVYRIVRTFIICDFAKKSSHGSIFPSAACGPLLRGDHQADDLTVGLGHAVVGHLAHVPDGVLHALEHDAVAAHKLAVVHLHLHSQQACFHGRSDLCGAAGLGTIADHTLELMASALTTV